MYFYRKSKCLERCMNSDVSSIETQCATICINFREHVVQLHDYKFVYFQTVLLLADCGQSN